MEQPIIQPIDGVVYSHDRKTDVSPDKLSDFLAIAKELGFKTGKL